MTAMLNRDTTMLDHVLDYAARGWHVFPVPPGTKKSHKSALHSGGRNWGNTNDPAEILRDWTRWPNANVGVMCGPESGVLVIEADTVEGHGVDGVANLKALIEQHGGLPDTVQAMSPSGSWHIWFAWPESVNVINSEGAIAPGVDVRGNGGMVVAAPSVKPGAANPYRWINPPGLHDLAPCPDWLLKLCPEKPDIERAVLDALNSAPNTLERADWVRLGLALKGTLGGRAYDGWLAFSSRYAGDTEPGEAERQWETANPDGSLSIGTAAHLLGIANGTKGKTRKDKMAGEVSEHEIALAFTRHHGDRLRFDHNAGKWYEWTGTRWRRNDTKIAFHYARTLAVKLSRGDSSFSRAGVANGAESFARADPVHAVTADVWDRDPYLIGTPGGTVNLKTGAYYRARQADMITKQTGVSPENGEPTLWLEFLEQATNGDAELIRFLRQVAGYCLTGLTNEHALFFIYGPGGNGKSVFLNTLNYIMGDYATTASMDTFTASKSDRHPTDLAMLNGARLVSASETEEGRAWAESRIKQLTGGDRISARFMRQDFFEFIPQFKLVIVGNHAPVLANVDEAARRRFNIIPFTQKPARPDRQLEDKLKLEAGRILAWAIDGCKDWQDNGLVRPAIVTTATADYFDDQDLFGQWIIDRCETSSGKWELPTPLYNDWAEYARAAGDDPGTQRAMSSKLKRAGFQPKKGTGGMRSYQGIALKPKANQGWGHD